MKRLKYISGLVVLCFLSVACTTMQPVKESTATEEIEREVKPGDEVRLVTKNGEEHVFVFSSISDGYIFGQEESFKLEDIQTLEVKKLTGAGYAVAYTSAAALGIAEGTVKGYAALPLAVLIAVILLPLAL